MSRAASLAEYRQRIDRVLDHIATHLDGDLRLATLARVARFSPFHFHRIFQSMIGETVGAHVRRMRVERAALLLRSSPRRSITDVALAAGFGGLSELSRAFKERFGVAPSRWDRKARLVNRKIRQAASPVGTYSDDELTARWRAFGLRVRRQRLGPTRFVHVRIHDPYGSPRIAESHAQLVAALAARGEVPRDAALAGMQQDDPTVTPPAQCRYDLGVLYGDGGRGDLLEELARMRRRPRPGHAPPSRAAAARLGLAVRELPAMEVAWVRCDGPIEVADVGIQYLYRIWLPASGLQPAELPAFELFVRGPDELGWETFDVCACLPLARF